MRHNKKGFKLGRTRAHRQATLASLSTALIKHKRITTTLVKAKALRQYVEPVINRAKDSSTHSRRQAFRHLRSKEAVKELFDDVASAIGDRPGGYTRIVKLGQRAGDAAEMAVIELVDYNDVAPSGTTGTSSSRRTRRGGGRGRRGKAAKAAAPATTQTTTTSDQTAMKAKAKGVESTTVEEPVDEAQAVPVPERTEPNAEAKAAAEAAAAEQEAPEQEAPEQEAAENVDETPNEGASDEDEEKQG